MTRQREMLEETLRDVSDMAEGYRRTHDPRDLATRQADFARKSFETAVRNTGEVADLVRKSSSEAIDILRKRIREGMEEIRESVDKRK
jgi:phasin family protein